MLATDEPLRSDTGEGAVPEIQISDATATLLTELHGGFEATRQGPPTTPAWLVENAIERVHRGFFGLAEGAPGAPDHTGRFEKWVSDRGAEVLLRQIDAKNFCLAQPSPSTFRAACLRCPRAMSRTWRPCRVS